MAQKEPLIYTPAGTITAGVVNPDLGVLGGVNAIDASLITNGTHYPNRNGMKLRIFSFIGTSNDADDTDVWDASSNFPPPDGLAACAWQGVTPNSDRMCATITAAQQITFSGTASSAGWLWVLSRA